jgi:hypothetical protein
MSGKLTSASAEPSMRGIARSRITPAQIARVEQKIASPREVVRDVSGHFDNQACSEPTVMPGIVRAIALSGAPAVIAGSEAGEAISVPPTDGDCFAALAMTGVAAGAARCLNLIGKCSDV